MYISKLYLRAFGKFIYKKIYLGKKLNIIYGENEAGKSTIHNFIEDVLYGFDNDRDGAEQLRKYKPWDNKLYRGSISIDDGDTGKFMIARDFLLDTVKIMKKEYADDEEGRQSQEAEGACPGEFFFRMNRNAFRNTVSIRQLGNKTDEELSSEVKRKIVNLSKSRDESISVEKILDRLSKIKEEAGDENNPKTLLGQYAIRLGELERARENILNMRRQTIFLAREKKQLKSKIDDINTETEAMKAELAEFEQYEKKALYSKAAPVKQELDKLNDALGRWTAVNKEFAEKDYDEILKIADTLLEMRSGKQVTEDELKALQDEEKRLAADPANNIPSWFSIDDLNSEYKAYKESISAFNALKNKVDAGKSSLDKVNITEVDRYLKSHKDLERNNDKINAIKILMNTRCYDVLLKFSKNQSILRIMLMLLGLILIAGSAVSCYQAYLTKMLEYYAGAALILPSGFAFMVAVKAGRRSLSAKKEIESIECEQADYSRNISIIKSENEDIIKASGYENEQAFNESYEEMRGSKAAYEEKKCVVEKDEDELTVFSGTCDKQRAKLSSSLSALSISDISDEAMNLANEIYNRKDDAKSELEKIREKISNVSSNLTKLLKEISFEEKRQAMILSSNHMTDADEFRMEIERRIEYETLISRKNECEQALNSMLKGVTLEELAKQVEDIPDMEMDIDKGQYLTTLYQKNDEKTQILDTIRNIDEEIGNIEKNQRSLVAVEEELEFYRDKINSFKERILIADVAAEKIREISDCIKGDFMPLLRKSISENFSYVTDGKYKEVMLDDDMNLSLKSDEKKDGYVNIDDLSGGTLDQLYLSLRISIGNILSGNRYIPLILDDSFVQYDNSRLKKSMEMLERESERRQIILFTCQRREIELARQMNMKFNLIKL